MPWENAEQVARYFPLEAIVAGRACICWLLLRRLLRYLLGHGHRRWRDVALAACVRAQCGPRYEARVIGGWGDRPT